MKSLLILLIFIVIFFTTDIFVFPKIADAQVSQNNNLSTSFSQVDKEIDLIKEEYKNLKEQNKEMMIRLENERKNHYDFVERTYSEIRIIFLLAASCLVAVFTFFNWKNKNDLKQDLKDSNLKLTKNVEEFKLDAKNKLESQFSEIVAIEAGNIQADLFALRQIIDSYTGYRNKRILILGEKKQIVSISDSIERLKQKSFQYIDIVEESGFNAENFNPNNYDLIIYMFKERDATLPKEQIQPQDSNILDILDLLKGSKLPVLIYTKNNKLPNEVLNRYEWILPINTQITLMNGVFIISNLLEDNPRL